MGLPHIASLDVFSFRQFGIILLYKFTCSTVIVVFINLKTRSVNVYY